MIRFNTFRMIQLLRQDVPRQLFKRESKPNSTSTLPLPQTPLQPQRRQSSREQTGRALGTAVPRQHEHPQRQIQLWRLRAARTSTSHAHQLRCVLLPGNRDGQEPQCGHSPHHKHIHHHLPPRHNPDVNRHQLHNGARNAPPYSRHSVGHIRHNKRLRLLILHRIQVV